MTRYPQDSDDERILRLEILLDLRLERRRRTTDRLLRKS
jgi:hypothetical protein